MPSKTRKNKNTHIQHHHMLLRMETKKFPKREEQEKVANLIRRIILDLDMDIIGAPHLHYLDTPLENKGFTGVASIQTSHVSFHFWDVPAKGWLQNTESNSLLQFDIYTCGNLKKHHIKKVIKHLSIYEPTRIDIDVMNRKHTLKLDAHYQWDSRTSVSFRDWITTI
jgi:S-adenosylmethionine/arginine decarboxylase-like enzyme